MSILEEFCFIVKIAKFDQKNDYLHDLGIWKIDWKVDLCPKIVIVSFDFFEKL